MQKESKTAYGRINEWEGKKMEKLQLVVVNKSAPVITKGVVSKC
jgi:hypothetical protein